ncbi:capsid protein [Rhizobiaceae bacterium]|nr:capsid protein [Rhizobiaceae bacterium]
MTLLIPLRQSRQTRHALLLLLCARIGYSPPVRLSSFN